jgi:hypothetical protein
MARSVDEYRADGLDADRIDRICERHAWQLARSAPGTLLAPLDALFARRRDALAAALDRSRAARPGVLPPGSTPAAWVGERAAALLRRPAACPLCATEAKLDSEAVANAVERGPAVALCRIHLILAARAGRAGADWSGLLERQATRWRRLSHDLAEFIRKHDYRFSQETRGEERDSPWRAVEEIAGRKGSA